MTDLSRTPVTLIGASRGLGRVLAETFHHLGAQVLVVAGGQAGHQRGGGAERLATGADRPAAGMSWRRTTPR